MASLRAATRVVWDQVRDGMKVDGRYRERVVRRKFRGSMASCSRSRCGSGGSGNAKNRLMELVEDQEDWFLGKQSGA